MKTLNTFDDYLALVNTGDNTDGGCFAVAGAFYTVDVDLCRHGDDEFCVLSVFKFKNEIFNLRDGCAIDDENDAEWVIGYQGTEAEIMTEYLRIIEEKTREYIAAGI